MTGLMVEAKTEKQAEVMTMGIIEERTDSATPSASSPLGGVYRFRIENGTPVLEHAGSGLCALAARSPEEFSAEAAASGYAAAFVNDPDRERYLASVARLAEEEGRLVTVHYGLLRPDGFAIPVQDTMLSQRGEDGIMRGYSAVSVRSAEVDDGDVDDAEENFGLYGVVELGIAADGKAEASDCNRAFLELAGLGGDAARGDRAAALSVLNIVMRGALTQFARSHTSGSSGVDYSHGFLPTVGGAFREVSCWSRWDSDEAGGTRCRITCVPVSGEELFRRDAVRASFIDAMSDVYDLVFEVDALKRCGRCVYSSLEAPGLRAADIPFELEYAQDLVASKYLTESGLEAFKHALEPLSATGGVPSSQLACRLNVGVYAEGAECEANVFMYSIGGYIYIMAKLAAPTEGVAKRVRIRTFGYFEVFVDGRPLAFKHPKARELMALLVDRRGGLVPSREAASVLWEDEDPTKAVMARYRKVAMYLKETLEEAGVGHIVESSRGKRRILLRETDCDLMDYLRLGDRAPNRFHGAYMREYSWAEATLGELVFRSQRK